MEGSESNQIITDPGSWDAQKTTALDLEHCRSSMLVRGFPVGKLVSLGRCIHGKGQDIDTGTRHMKQVCSMQILVLKGLGHEIKFKYFYKKWIF